jgi:ferrous iron transport protein B
MNNNKKEIDEAKKISAEVVKSNNELLPKKTDKIDRIATHPVFGLVIFVVIMVAVFTISQNFIGPYLSDLMAIGFDWFGGLVEGWLTTSNTSDFLSGLVLEGIIGGFAAVAGFLPLIMVLFFLLQLLEDSGYMSRVAIVMDRYFKPIGLAGKSIIPMYVGTACSIPAIMATRTIKNERQRKLTILLTPFVPCGAKLPVIALFVTVFFAGTGWMTALTYFMAILVIFLAGFLMKFILGIKNEQQTFDQYHFVELPDYQAPSIKQSFLVMIDRGWEFIKKAGTIIVLMNGLIWLMSNFNFQFQLVTNPDESILKNLATPLAFLLTPLGFGIWGMAAAAILGFVAKEEVVGALAVVFAFGITEDFGIENIENIRLILMNAGGLTAVSAFSFMAFNLFTPPCFAAIGAMRTELESMKWTAFGVGFQLLVGYVVSMVIYQVGTLMFYGTIGQGFIASLIILLIVSILILSIYLKKKRAIIHG